MIKMPLEQIITKIKASTGMSEEDIKDKIQNKAQALAGLISQEGAAHIIANELGVRLFEAPEGKIAIKDILAGMRNVQVVAKITQIFPIREFQRQGREGKVASVVIADETGSTRAVFWNQMADLTTQMTNDDIVKIKGGYIKENMGRKEIHLNDRSEVKINPEGEKLGKVKAEPQQGTFEAKRKKINEIKESDGQAEIVGSIVQAFDPNFFEVCPKCGKRARQQGDAYTCQEHGPVEPDYSYVGNVIVDDGTDSIRIVCFRDQLETLLGKKKEELLVIKEEPPELAGLKNELLGKLVKVTGRITKNNMFDRLEIVARNIDSNPDPQKEIERLEKEPEQTKQQAVVQQNQQAAPQSTPELTQQPAQTVQPKPAVAEETIGTEQIQEATESRPQTEEEVIGDSPAPAAEQIAQPAVETVATEEKIQEENTSGTETATEQKEEIAEEKIQSVEDL